MAVTKKDVKLKQSSTKLEIFAKKVFSRLLRENIYPIPYYYSIYFFNMLEEESEEFKRSVMEIIALESNNELDEGLKFEQQLKKSFQYSKKIVKDSAMIYKLSSLLKDKNSYFIKEIDNVASPQAFKSMLLNSKKTNQVINKKLAVSLQELKEDYARNLATLKEIEKESIYDAEYGVYNNKYFLSEVDKEIKQIETLQHISSIIVLRIRKDVLKKLKSEKYKIIANKMIAKILLKTSRRTDVVAHLGDGKFGMLLKHTDKIGAMRTSERLADMISNSSMFIDNSELEIKIAIGIVELTVDSYRIESLSCAFDKIEEAEKEDKLYKICEEEDKKK